MRKREGRWSLWARVKTTFWKGVGGRCRRPLPTQITPPYIVAGAHDCKPRIEFWAGGRGATRRCHADGSTQDVASHRAEPAALPRPSLVARARQVVAAKSDHRIARPRDPSRALATPQHQGVRIRERRRSDPPSPARKIASGVPGLPARVRGAHPASRDRPQQRQTLREILRRSHFLARPFLGQGVRLREGPPFEGGPRRARPHLAPQEAPRSRQELTVAQCLKCLTPVSTIATPARSAAAMTSASFARPPG